MCATDLFEIKWTKHNLFYSIPNTVWISCAVFEFLEVWQQACDCSLGDICIGQWGSKYGGGWGGRLLFSFNISSEPISKSSSAWIQLSSANYPHYHLRGGHITMSSSAIRLKWYGNDPAKPHTVEMSVRLLFMFSQSWTFVWVTHHNWAFIIREVHPTKTKDSKLR